MEQKIVGKEIKENEEIHLRGVFENETVMMRCAPYFTYSHSLKNQDKQM